MPREILLNAFEMNCVGHIQQGLRRHPRDQSTRYLDLAYWSALARTLEDALFDGLFLADVLGVYDVYGGNADAALRGGVQVPVNDPMMLIRAYEFEFQTASARVGMWASASWPASQCRPGGLGTGAWAVASARFDQHPSFRVVLVRPRNQG